MIVIIAAVSGDRPGALGISKERIDLISALNFIQVFLCHLRHTVGLRARGCCVREISLSVTQR